MFNGSTLANGLPFLNRLFSQQAHLATGIVHACSSSPYLVNFPSFDDQTSIEMTDNQHGESPVLFDELADLLVELGGGSHPSELHGLLCGTFSGGSEPGVEAWNRQVSSLLGDEAIGSSGEEMLSRMYQLTLDKLRQADFGIAMLLPDDEEALEQRTEALGYWCQGFLSGFGEAAANRKISAEAEGVINDLSEIAQIQPEQDDSDEAERFFMEVSEFVRMAMITLFAEFNKIEVPADEQGKTLH
ncbi:hypothetical protein EOPP23_05995 [Endozoicomonas sp. OPT23]|uniref:UPF0149 family protein n=1 Tax=Endozoicomonas sp. OPT23 TaxID=2072845 RepID=UPI00129B8A72|nr:UPF0149 family protein [Endozoicomonas sp. OPT23]MRI32537.1 hypothetical protein [Endozoicomonas sp. OPT23]